MVQIRGVEYLHNAMWTLIKYYPLLLLITTETITTNDVANDATSAGVG